MLDHRYVCWTIISSAKEVIAMPGVCLCVCRFVCLSVCLLVFHARTTERIFTKILPQMYLWAGKNCLNFGSYPLPHPDPGFFWWILQRCKIGHFSQFGSYLWTKWSDLREYFITNVTLDRKSPLNFESHADPKSGSVSGLPMRTRFSLVEVCALPVLLFMFMLTMTCTGWPKTVQFSKKV